MYFVSQKQNIFLTMLLLAVFSVGLLFAANASAAPNQQINYQGKLLASSSAAVADGTVSIQFSLYTAATGGSNIWTETNSVDTASGLFSVMLGSSTSLSGVDFNQTLYLGINVAADGEMSPRKIMGIVPAAFESVSLGGATSTQYLRSDEATALIASEAATLLTITQSGAGDILNLFDDTTEVFTVTDGGLVGIGTTTPAATFAVNGSMYTNSTVQFANLGNGFLITDAAGNISTSSVSAANLSDGDFGDFSVSAGTATLDADVVSDNEIDYTNVTLADFTDDVGFLQDITSELFVDLSDTPASYTANRILFTNAGGTAVTDSAGLTFDGSLFIAPTFDASSSTLLSQNGTRMFWSTTTSDSIALGEGAGNAFNDTGLYNTALGYQAGFDSGSTIGSDRLTAVGYQSAYQNTGDSVTALGYFSAYQNTGNSVTALGRQSAYLNSGVDVTASGHLSARENTGDYVTASGYRSAYLNSGNGVTAQGHQSAFQNTGSFVTTQGYASAYQNTGANVTASGYFSAYQNTGSNVTAQGYNTAYQNTGSNLTTIGTEASRYRNAPNSTIIGYQAGYGQPSTRATTSNNLILGYQSGYSIDTGADNNILLGYQAA
ncbi:MAG: hypothetical protein ACI9H6_000483, partial [Patiriisocius sp.]